MKKILLVLLCCSLAIPSGYYGPIGTSGGGGGGGVTDHGALTGLSDDDHPQYSLVDGTRAFTGTVTITGGGLSATGNVSSGSSLIATTNVLAGGSVTGSSLISTGNIIGAKGKVCQTLHINYTPVGTVGGGEDTLMSYTVPANTLAYNGDFLEWDAGIKTGGVGTQDTTIKCYWGVTELFNTGAVTADSASLHAWGRIIRVSSTSQTTENSLTTDNSSIKSTAPYQSRVNSMSEDLTGSVVLKCTGQDASFGAGNDQVSQKYLIVKYCPY